MKSKRKDYILIFMTFLVVALSVVLFFYPSLINYPYSYNNLVEKKGIVEEKNANLTKNEVTIKNKRNELEVVTTEKEEIYLEAAMLRRNINEEDFKLRMPSFLISMEQQAYKEKIKLNIDYAAIQTISNGSNAGNNAPDVFNNDDRKNNSGVPKPKGTEETADKKDLDKLDRATNPKDNIKIEEVAENQEKDKSEQKDNDKNTNEMKFSQEEIANGAIVIEGIDVTVIPISIEGSYHNVRSYLKYLDEIGMIEPSSVILNSEGKLVKGKVILNIFHGEVL